MVRSLINVSIRRLSLVIVAYSGVYIILIIYLDAI